MRFQSNGSMHKGALTNHATSGVQKPNSRSRLRVRNFIISGTSFWNPGDDFVRGGVKHVLQALFPSDQLNFHFYNFNPDYFPKSKFPGIDNAVSQGDLDICHDHIDGIIIAGLSAGYELKDLYRWVIKNKLEDRVYLIGAGYESGYCAQHICQEPEATIFRNARIVIGRTEKHPDFITQVGAPYVRLNCPALLSVENVKTVAAGQRIERIGFSIQLPHADGIVNQSTGADAFKLCTEVMCALARTHEVELVTHHKTEYFFFLEALKDTRIPVIYTSFYEDLHKIYPRYDAVITTRLHASLFANGFGIPGIIINDTDRHTHTAKGFPHSVCVNTQEGFDREWARLNRLDLQAVAAEMARFKGWLTERYVENLAPAFESGKPKEVPSQKAAVFPQSSEQGNSLEPKADGPAGQTRSPRRILFVRTDSIGDAVLASSMLEPLRNQFPEAQIGILCQRRVAELFLACPYVSTVICYEIAQLQSEENQREIVRDIVQFNPDMVLNSVRSRDPLSEALTRVCRGARRIAIESDGSNIDRQSAERAGREYDVLIPSTGSWKTELARHEDFLKGLGISVSGLQPAVWTAAEDDALAEEFVRTEKLNPERTIAIFPGAQHQHRWYEGFGDALSGLTGFDFLIFGTGAEHALGETVRPKLQGRVWNLCGKTTLNEMVALLRRCRLYVGTESAGAHIACALKIPNVVVLGGGHFGRFMPYSPLTSAVVLPLDCFGCNWQCRHSSVHCIKDVSPTTITEAVLQALAGTALRPRILLQASTAWKANQAHPEWKVPNTFVKSSDVEFITIGKTSSGTPDASSPEAEIGSCPISQAARTPSVSAIVSTYKSERFLRGCLEDLEKQTIAHDLEIIVVDSGSPQREKSIVEEFQKRFDNIVYIRTEERETVYGAWNRGIKAARGKYVTNANTDDRHRRDAYEVMARALDENPRITLAYADCLVTRTENETFDKATVVKQFKWLDFNAADLLLKGCFVGPQPMWRREVHDEHGYFDAAMVSAGDYEFWLRIAQTRNFLHIKEALGLYLESPTSVEHANGALAAKEVELARKRYGARLVPGFRLPGATQASEGTAPPAKAPQKAEIRLPATALIGRIEPARESLRRKDYQNAWEQTVRAVETRPFHPEAFLLLAEIAVAVGSAHLGRLAAQHAARLVPHWKKAKRFQVPSARENSRPAWMRLPKVMSESGPQACQPQLSVCLITKNEERFIEGCLKSIQGLAAQIVVVDTGSTDRTVEIAKGLGAEIFTFTWCDDFSAARNAALEHATGDWVLMLDADEELPPDQHARLRADISQPGSLAYRVPLMNHGKSDGVSYVPRLFRNAPGVFYTGRIHEQVFRSLLPYCKAWQLKMPFGNARLLHHGYSAEMVKERSKVERNLRLLEQAVQEEPTDANLVMNLGLELVRSGNLQQGLTKYREAFRLMSSQTPREVVPELREVLLTQYSFHLHHAREHDEMIKILSSPLAKNGGLTASHYFALGLAYYEQKKHAEAAEQMRLCLKKRHEPALSPINTDILTGAPHHCLALNLDQLGDLEGADEAYKSALADAGANEKIKLDYARWLAKQDRPVEALQRLHEVVAENPNSALAWQFGATIALQKPEFLEVACDWTAAAYQALPQDCRVIAHRAEALLLSGQAIEALSLWRRLTMAGDARNVAGHLICAVVAGERDEDIATPASRDREVMEWFKRLVRFGAEPILRELQAKSDILRIYCPTAGKQIEDIFSSAVLAA